MEEYSQNLEKDLEDLEMEVETLNAMINELLKRVSKEKDKGLKTLPEVEKWILMAEEVELKASGVLDESISECHTLTTYDDCSKISRSTLHYSEMVCVMLEEVKALRSKGVFKVLVERAPLSYVRKKTPIQPIVSREMLLEKAWKCLEENDCGTLGLYGMAEVGKTTLLTQIENKFREFWDVTCIVIFVVVESEEVKGIQDTILRRFGIFLRQKSERGKASRIYRVLNERRFVLLLDGVQREGVDLEAIGVPLPSRENGCKVVFTTRYQEACRSKWVDATLEVEYLSPEEEWDVFQEIVGETTLKSHPDIPQLARIVARKCGGFPIALSLIGEAMSRKRTVREWHHVIHALVSSTAGFSGSKVAILRFIYDNLLGENIRSCFLYCALFPKNSYISKQELIDCWICEGMIDEEDREIAETKGYEMIGDMIIMGFLMENKNGYSVKMRDMVHEMALWIASDSGRREENIVVKCGETIQQLPVVNDWRMVRRMSVTSTQIETISESPPSSELTTLFLQENPKLKRISGHFFRWMTSLAVLNLSSNTGLYVLPEEVSCLVSLRFLNLSWTGIIRLPLALKRLTKLIHLDLDATLNLQYIDVIAGLLNLQVLKLLRSAVPVDLKLLECLQLLESLQELSLTVKDPAVSQRLLSNHRLANCIRSIGLDEITIVEGGILSLKSGFRELEVLECNIPEITIDWRSLSQRETVHSGNIEKIPQFLNIRSVTLSQCRGLRDLTWLLYAPSLKHLGLFYCPQLEQVVSKEKAMEQVGHTSEHPFQNLISLSLLDLPQLENIYWAPLPFPVMECMQISRCPKLRRIPLDSDSAKGNQVRLHLEKEWIKGVEWEDEATKQRVSHLNNISRSVPSSLFCFGDFAQNGSCT
ncbi:unnamed protein product [Thlaspi arvense]|uniref:NB-ARC domain-containing protein n=1 Tax=Thlaspi arvense TaxID=13288 RepID=A0AAU9RLS4_THLAR|nr:unnamed protein product [Thlaspi arvense]